MSVRVAAGRRQLAVGNVGVGGAGGAGELKSVGERAAKRVEAPDLQIA